MFATANVIFTSIEITAVIKWDNSRMIPAVPEHHIFFVNLIDVDWACSGSVEYQ